MDGGPDGADGVRDCANAIADACANACSDAEPDACTDAVADPGANAGSHAGAHAGAHTGSVAGAHALAHASADAEPHAGADSRAHAAPVRRRLARLRPGPGRHLLQDDGGCWQRNRWYLSLRVPQRLLRECAAHAAAERACVHGRLHGRARTWPVPLGRGVRGLRRGSLRGGRE